LVGTLLDKLTGGFLSKLTGKIANSIFGGKVTTLDSGFTINSTTLGGAVSNGVNAGQYTDTKKDGGWFHSDKYNTSLNSLGAAANDQFTLVIKSMADSLTAAAKVFGVGGDDFTKHLNSFVIDIGKISLKDLSGDEIEKAINAVFSKLGDDMAVFAFGNLTQYQKIGEGFLETIGRLANDLLQVNDVFKVLGKTIPTGVEGIAAAEKMIENFGGVDNLTSGVKSYMTSILTESQQLDLVKKSVADAMNGLGLAGVTTREQFKAIIDSMDATSASFATLIAIAPLFGQVVDATEKSVKAVADQQIALLDAQGRSAESLALSRKKELDAMDASLRAVQMQIYAEQDKAKTEELQVALLEAQGDAAGALAITRRRELLALNETDAAIQKQIYAMKDAVDALDPAYSRLTKSVNAQKEAIEAAAEAAKDAAQTELDATKTRKDALDKVVGSLDKALQGSEKDNSAVTASQRAEAEATLATIRANVRAGGDITKMTGLDNALTTIAKPSEDLFKSFEDYARDQAKTTNVLNDLRDNAMSASDYAQLTIDRLDATIKAIDSQKEADIKYLDGILSRAQDQIDAIKGVDTSVQSLSQAMQSFATAISAATGTKINQTQGSGAAISSLYQSILGRDADAGGMSYWQNAIANGSSVSTVASQIQNSSEGQTKLLKDIYQNALGRPADAAGLSYWQNALANGASMTDIEKAIRGSTEAKGNSLYVPSLAVGTSELPADMLIQAHKGEAVIPAADNAEIKRRLASSEDSSTSNGEVVAAIADLKDAIMSGDLANVMTAKDLLRIIKRWDQEGTPSERIETVDAQ
jgi:hypothetical protein